MRPARHIRIATFEVHPRAAKAYRDCESGEFIVKFFLNGIRQKGSDYFTDSRSDALGTAQHWVNTPRDVTHSVPATLER